MKPIFLRDLESWNLNKTLSLAHFKELLLIITLVLLGIDIFINLPMNGIYRLSGQWSKDTNIILRMMASVAFAFTVNYYLPKKYLNMSLYICVAYLCLYYYDYKTVALSEYL